MSQVGGLGCVDKASEMDDDCRDGALCSDDPVSEGESEGSDDEEDKEDIFFISTS